MLLNKLTFDKKVFANFTVIVFSGSCICTRLNLDGSRNKRRTLEHI